MNEQELDKWIHENLFEGDRYVGLRKHGLWYRPDAHGYTSLESEAGRYLIGDALKHTTEQSDDVEDAVTVKSFTTPRYTTGAAACGLVRKKLYDKDCRITYMSTDDNRIYCRIESISYADVECVADSEELATCQAVKAMLTQPNKETK